MNTQPDFEDFLKLLETHQVDYMIVGGYAVAYHGFPRFTKDIDIFFDDSSVNVDRLMQALVDFGFNQRSIPRDTLQTAGKVLAIGVAPVRIDLINQISGLSFIDARPNTIRGQYGEVMVTFIGRDDLIQNKSSTSRAKDKADVEELT